MTRFHSCGFSNYAETVPYTSLVTTTAAARFAPGLVGPYPGGRGLPRSRLPSASSAAKTSCDDTLRAVCVYVVPRSTNGARTGRGVIHSRGGRDARLNPPDRNSLYGAECTPDVRRATAGGDVSRETIRLIDSPVNRRRTRSHVMF